MQRFTLSPCLDCKCISKGTFWQMCDLLLQPVRRGRENLYHTVSVQVASDAY
jgi:hypothetical protein